MLRRRAAGRRMAPVLTGALLVSAACSGPAVTTARRATSRLTTTTVAPTTTTAPPPAPPPVTPLVSPPLSGEGQWTPAGQMSEGIAAVYTTTLRAPGAPPTGLAWINTHAVRITVYAGNGEPSGTWTYQSEIDGLQRAALIAAFNSGFRLGASGGGWYSDGRTAVPLVQGAASLVVHADGSATVGQWGRDVSLSPDVVQVRQNLRLLVDAGSPVGNLSPGSWGATFGRVSNTWRSGLGETMAGDLVYAGGPGLSPGQLARVLVAAGSVRAMELDINPEWVLFVSYLPLPGGGPTDVTGSKLLDNMNFSWDHYLHPNSRDFIAVLSR